MKGSRTYEQCDFNINIRINQRECKRTSRTFFDARETATAAAGMVCVYCDSGLVRSCLLPCSQCRSVEQDRLRCVAASRCEHCTHAFHPLSSEQAVLSFSLPTSTPSVLFVATCRWSGPRERPETHEKNAVPDWVWRSRQEREADWKQRWQQRTS